MILTSDRAYLLERALLLEAENYALRALLKKRREQRDNSRDALLIELHDYQRLTFVKIAERLGMSRQTVQRHYHRAKGKQT